MNLSRVEKTRLRTWIELDKKSIAKNYKLFRKIINTKTKLMSVVKSNAYGHNLVTFAKEIVRLGIDFLGVDSIDEALELRKSGIKTKILVFGYVSPAYYALATSKNISITISNLYNLKALSKQKLKDKLHIHVKIDTGLGRQGFLPKDVENVINILRRNQYRVEVEGIYSHFAVGESIKKKSYTIKQTNKLNECILSFNKAGFKPMKHICATSSTMFFPELHYDMVRVGIGMYGLWPSRETKETIGSKYKLHPVLSWKTIITETKILPRGSRIGYDLTEELKKESKLAVIPVGYWHGYPRILSSKGLFCVNGKKVKVVGRVSMDMMVLDITNAKAKVGDEVTIIMGNNGHFASAEKVADNANTINYEIVTRINPLVKRFLK
jgi:alanine racemase